MIASEQQAVAILGYGNPGRRDDGLGPALVAALDDLGQSGLTLEAAYQLNIEDAATIAGCERALFVDASMGCAEPFELQRVVPADRISFTSHAVSPGSLLAICEEHFEAAPEAWVLAIRGYEFELGEGLTPAAARNLEAAVHFVRKLLRGWRS